MNNKISFFLLIICLLIASQCKKSSTHVTGNVNGCQVVSRIDSQGYEYKFDYDNMGRVVKLSVFDSPDWSEELFSYSGNSVNASYSFDNHQYQIPIMLNAGGWPTSITLPNGTSYTGNYNSDGTLKIITDNLGNTWDSISYSAGNIVSLRYTTSGASVVYSYSYFTNSFIAPYDPQDKLFDLCGTWFVTAFGSGSYSGYNLGFTPQTFSKNVLKTVNNAGGTRSYSYQFDLKGNITYATVPDSTPFLGNTYRWMGFSYNCY